jgi:hypothetical protein
MRRRGGIRGGEEIWHQRRGGGYQSAKRLKIILAENRRRIEKGVNGVISAAWRENGEEANQLRQPSIEMLAEKLG